MDNESECRRLLGSCHLHKFSLIILHLSSDIEQSNSPLKTNYRINVLRLFFTGVN